MTFLNGGDHPAITDAKRRLETLERRTPPGYPLGYILETTEIFCGGCGRKTEVSRLLVITRKGADSKALRPSGASEVVYDLPVEQRRVAGGTARCFSCVATLPTEAVPRLPPPTARLHNHREAVEIDLDELFGGKI